MATTTPNFGWPVPTSTDLVKDGATAIEALGDSIDASLLDLKGGTTGQVLAKATNTNMDFVWVAQDDSNAIQNSIVDAKGDLIAASANDTPARLAVGNNGETLVADSSTSTGLRYTAGNPIPNPVINSCFDIWQRGTSISVAASTNVYTADRWYTSVASSQACTVSRQVTNDSTNLPNIQYAMRFQRNSGQTGTTPVGLYNSFETTNSIPFAGKTITYSFYARGGATFLSSGATLTAAFTTGTGTDQNAGTGYTGGATPLYSNPAITATWQRFSYTITLSATLTELAPFFVIGFAGTAGATDFVEITGVQIDIGSVALPVRRNGATIQGELAACQRYYYRTTALSAYANLSTSGYATGTTTGVMLTQFPVTMRTTPAAIETTGTAANYALLSATGSIIACNAVPTFDANSNTQTGAFSAGVASGLVAGNATQLRANNVTTAYLGWSAEL